jgi:hypothetical protein
MKFFSAFFFLGLFSMTSAAQQLSSSVYECRFENNLVATQSLRMKDYFDTQVGQRAGKVDLLNNLNLIESTPTLVYQIPFINQQFYLQIWYSKDVRVDSQMSLTGSNRTFPATYHKGPMQEDLFCTTLSN